MEPLRADAPVAVQGSAAGQGPRDNVNSRKGTFPHEETLKGVQGTASNPERTIVAEDTQSTGMMIDSQPCSLQGKSQLRQPLRCTA